MARAGQVDTKDLTDDQVEELVGEMALEARAWVPLCPSFPELKGVTCEAVEGYREGKLNRSETCGPIYSIAAARMAQQMELPLETLKMEYASVPEVDMWESKRRGDEPMIDTWIRSEIESNVEISPTRTAGYYSYFTYDNPAGERKIIDAGWPQDGVGEEAYENLKAMMIHRLDPVFRELKDDAWRARGQGINCHLGMDITGGDPRMAYLASRYNDMATGLLQLKVDLYDRDYFNNVKVFTRDDLYDVAVELGKQLSGGYDLIAETYRQWKIAQRWGASDIAPLEGASAEMLRRWMGVDEEWQRTGRSSSLRYRSEFVEKHGVDDILADPHTIFITTPRGGFEFLSIFSYANNLGKARLPTDVVSTWELAVEDILEGGKPGWEVPVNEYFGYTWLGDASMPIHRIVIVDDIVESGDQQQRTRQAVRERFGPDIEVLSIAACGRRWPHPNEYNRMFWNETEREYVECSPDVSGEYAAPCEEGLVNVFSQARYGHEVLELQDWRDRMDAWLKNYKNAAGPFLCTCAFPWSITDSRPSLYLRDVYGTRWERGRGRGAR